MTTFNHQDGQHIEIDHASLYFEQQGNKEGPVLVDDFAGRIQPAFIPLPLQLAGGYSQAPSSSICIEIQNPHGTVKVNWPTESAAACATFLRDLLR